MKFQWVEKFSDDFCSRTKRMFRIAILFTFFGFLGFLCGYFDLFFYYCGKVGIAGLVRILGRLLGLQGWGLLLLGAGIFSLFGVKMESFFDDESSHPVAENSDSGAKSALKERLEERLVENLQEKKGDLGEQQRISEVRESLEATLNIETKKEEFLLVKQIENELEKKTGQRPVTNLTFNEVSDHQSKILDGTGRSSGI